jgi:U32 family peptidase
MPAGDFEKMQYAIAYGADAVYLGIPRYSLRARENGFDKDSVLAAIAYAHARNKKVYLTANILPHNGKVEPFIEYVNELLDQCRPDAWIMSDPGIISHMRERHPEQVIHLSVQANTVNYASARFWEKLGVSRIILSRELSIKEIARIKQECTGLELESFVHGAICVAYSGRCLLSSYLVHRDSNQGVCANSCRWQYRIYEREDLPNPDSGNEKLADDQPRTQQGDPYRPLSGDYYLEESERPGQFMRIDEDENGTYIMNARDLCALQYLEQLRDAGVESFKVEGRSKSLYYVAAIARTYRRAIDDLQAGKLPAEEQWREILGTANRGFFAGFLKGNPGPAAQNYEAGSQMSSRTFNFSAIIRSYDSENGRATIDVRSPIRVGAKLELMMPDKNITFTVEELYGRDEQPAEVIHGGINDCTIKLPCAPGEFGLLREPLDK